MKSRNKDIKSCYTTRELASLLNTSESQIYEYNASGYMGFPKGFKFGSQWRWKPESIDAWIAQRLLRDDDDSEKGVAVIVHSVKPVDDVDDYDNVFVDLVNLLKKLADKKHVRPSEAKSLLQRLDEVN